MKHDFSASIISMARLRSVQISLLIGTLVAGSALLMMVWGSSEACNLVRGIAFQVDSQHLVWFALLAIVSFALLVTGIPFGTATILLAGYFLGPLAGPVQFVSLVLASIVLYEAAREKNPARLQAELESYPQLARYAGLARRQGFWFSVLMRLVPVVPSAVASLAAAFFSVSRREFLLATLLAGWVRPVGFAVLGSLGRFAPICGINPSTAWTGA